jgi:hypothetical protein
MYPRVIGVKGAKIPKLSLHFEKLLSLSCGSVVEIFSKATSARSSLLWKITYTYM